jgi:hypothetical protein
MTYKGITHADWCAHLFARGCLNEAHRMCMGKTHCVANGVNTLIKQIERTADERREQAKAAGTS